MQSPISTSQTLPSTEAEGDSPARLAYLKGRVSALRASILLARQQRADLQPRVSLRQLQDLIVECIYFKNALSLKREGLRDKQEQLTSEEREKSRILSEQKAYISELMRVMDKTVTQKKSAFNLVRFNPTETDLQNKEILRSLGDFRRG